MKTMMTESESRKTQLILLFMLASFVFVSCSSGDASTRSGGQRVVWTAKQIANTGVISAYQAIAQLRPNFLRSAWEEPYVLIQPTTSTIIVYVDGMRQSDVSHLRNMAANNIQQIEYLDSKAGVERYGMGHDGGVINVTLK